MPKRDVKYRELQQQETTNPIHDDTLTDEQEQQARKAPAHATDFAEVKLTDLANIAIPFSYFLLGFLPSFFANPTTIYTVAVLNASPSQQNAIYVLKQLPWCFKILYGMVSDIRPIMGQHRKPYFIAGYAIHMLCAFRLYMLGAPSISALASYTFISSFGLLMADVMADTMIVSRAKLESQNDRGSFMALCYSVRFSGSVFGAVGGMLLYNEKEWHWGLSFAQLHLISALMPVTLLAPVVPFLHDPVVRTVAPWRDQLELVWNTIQRRAVFKPMAFVFVYNVLQLKNVAWSTFMQVGLKFSSFELGLMVFFGNCMTFAGCLLYKFFFFHASLRKIYIFTTIIPMVFSILQLLLIFRINRRWGISDIVFAVGDDIIVDLVANLQFLPVCIMMATFCHEGTEGATYSILTSYANVAASVGGTLSNLASWIWPVTEDTIARGDYSGMWKLTLTTSLVCVLPLLAMPSLLPNAAAQKAMSLSGETSRIGGIVFLTVLCMSIVWTFTTCMLSIYGVL